MIQITEKTKDLLGKTLLKVHTLTYHWKDQQTKTYRENQVLEPIIKKKKGGNLSLKHIQQFKLARMQSAILFPHSLTFLSIYHECNIF